MTMTTNTTKIAMLNDLCRQAIGVSSRVFQSQSIDDLPEVIQSAIREEVRTFNDFQPDNDPYGERDSGVFVCAQQLILWKIAYYDLDMMYLSEDPSDPSQTVRVLNIMLLLEY